MGNFTEMADPVGDRYFDLMIQLFLIGFRFFGWARKTGIISFTFENETYMALYILMVKHVTDYVHWCVDYVSR